MRSMLSANTTFKPYTPYHINQTLLFDLQLKVASISLENTPENPPRTVGEMLRTIIEENHEFSIERTPVPDNKRIKIDEKIFSFDNLHDDGAANTLIMLLEAAKTSEGVNEILNCTWYYVQDDDYVVNDPAAGIFYRFFLCANDQIIKPMLSIYNSTFPEGLLLEDTESFLANDPVYKVALARICYEQWMQDTLAGRTYATKLKMTQEKDLSSQTKLNVHGDIYGNSIPILALISSLKKELRIITFLLFCLAGFMFYFFATKL